MGAPALFQLPAIPYLRLRLTLRAEDPPSPRTWPAGRSWRWSGWPGHGLQRAGPRLPDAARCAPADRALWKL